MNSYKEEDFVKAGMLVNRMHLTIPGIGGDFGEASSPALLAAAGTRVVHVWIHMPG